MICNGSLDRRLQKLIQFSESKSDLLHESLVPGNSTGRTLANNQQSMRLAYYCLFYFSHILAKEKPPTLHLKQELYMNTFHYLVYFYAHMSKSRRR